MQTRRYKSTLVKSRTHQTKTATANTSGRTQRINLGAPDIAAAAEAALVGIKRCVQRTTMAVEVEGANECPLTRFEYAEKEREREPFVVTHCNMVELLLIYVFGGKGSHES